MSHKMILGSIGYSKEHPELIEIFAQESAWRKVLAISGYTANLGFCH